MIFYFLDVPSLFTHSPTEGHLGCFQFGAIINKAATNKLYVVFFVCGHLSFQHLWVNISVLLNCMVRVHCILLETTKLFFKVAG